MVTLAPFLGSGSSPAVALALDREAIGLELNPEYVHLAIERTEKAMAPVMPGRVQKVRTAVSDAQPDLPKLAEASTGSGDGELALGYCDHQRRWVAKTVCGKDPDTLKSRRATESSM